MTNVRVSEEEILGVLPVAVLVIDKNNNIVYANPTAEQFFQYSAETLLRLSLTKLISEDNPLLSLIAKARKQNNVISEFGFKLQLPRIEARNVSVACAPLGESLEYFVLHLQDCSTAGRLGISMFQRDAARSMRGMAAMMAHEVKNPLSGIRGAAQLLEQNVSYEDRELTKLIIEESDRICALVDEIDAFTESPEFKRNSVNIHEVLDHVINIAKRGFGSDMKITKVYDPSLPPVFGHRNYLIQIFLNLIKNACEACQFSDAELRIVTGFRHGIRVQATDSRLDLPISISIIDTGPGIPEDIEPHIFDPFVTTKIEGSGLGLPLAAKLITDHGGLIDLDTSPEGTTFQILLPMENPPIKEKLNVQ